MKRRGGAVRLVFEDAVSAGGGRWFATRLFASRDYPAATFIDLSLDATELEAAGLSLLSRLAALSRRRRV